MKKSRIATIIIGAVFLAGMFLLLYPTVSNLWNSYHQSRAIVDYTEQVGETSEETASRLWADAVEYNAGLAADADRFSMTDEKRKAYESQLNLSAGGVMGYLEIPRINCYLPIYHGTDSSALQTGIGHLKGSSLPTGGKGTHCVLSGHRGLPSAKLLTDLDEMEVGDLFSLEVLDQTLTYEVDQIQTVDPYDLSALEIDPEKDYCTLVTCTPYGINTHRLFVRGHRVASLETASADAMLAGKIRTIQVAAVVLPAAGAVTLFFLIRLRRRRSRQDSGGDS